MSVVQALAARRWRWRLSLIAALALHGCGGDSSSSGASTPHRVGGSVTGLTADGLQLANGTDALVLKAGSTSFTFGKSVAGGSSYAVSVQSDPAGLKCNVQNGAGTIGAQDVTDIRVACGPAAATYPLGGTVAGLSAGGLVISSVTDAVPVAAGATTFAMPTPLAAGTPYALSISAQPVGQRCSITHGTGAMPAAPVTSVAVTCAPLVTESVLYSFGTATNDGVTPTGTLIQATDGSLYGMTQAGGSKGLGTVFKVTPAGQESILYSFGSQGAGDGASPTHGGLVQASDGNFYAMTKSGGALGLGTVVRITPAGAESVLHSFGFPGDGASPEGGLIQASDGNLYGMTYAGGANGTGAIVKITLAGQASVLYSFDAANSGDGANPIGNLLQASDGHLYGMTYSGGTGAGNGGTFFRVTLGGGETVLHAFAQFGDVAGSSPEGALVQAADGSFYGVAYGGSSGAGVLLKLSASGAVSVLDTFSSCCGASAGGSLLQAKDGSFYAFGAAGANGTGALLRATPSGSLAVVYSFQAAGSPDGASPGVGSLIQGIDGQLYGTTERGGANNSGAIVRFALSPG